MHPVPHGPIDDRLVLAAIAPILKPDASKPSWKNLGGK
jgi:hypothetical protein